MADTHDLVQELSLGGKTIDGNSQFFYALIAMACLYGCFIGFGAAITLQANLTALAARRCVTPTHKLKLILSEQITSFLLGYTDVIILLIYLRDILKLDFQGQIGKMLIISLFGSLIGVSVGLFVGSLGKLSEGIKVAVILAISMVCSFLAGLMNSNMKDLVEKHAPIINRINPAALIPMLLLYQCYTMIQPAITAILSHLQLFQVEQPRDLARDSGQRKLTYSLQNHCASSRSVYLSRRLDSH